MNIHSAIAVKAVGTAEGVRKEWDTRGRKGEESNVSSKCIGPNCDKPTEELRRKVGTEPVIMPQIDHLELMMTSGRGGRNIHFDKQALKEVLHAALLQLERDEVDARYLNSNSFGNTNTDHYISLKFSRTRSDIHGAKS